MIVEYKFLTRKGERGEAVHKINPVPAEKIEKTLLSLDGSLRSVEIILVRKMR